MEWMVQETAMKGKALCVLPMERLLCWYQGNFLVYSLKDETILRKIHGPLAGWKRTLCGIRVIERLMHTEARWGYVLDHDEVLVQCGQGIWRLNCNSGEIQRENVPVKGRPLSISRVENVAGFRNAVVVGDYSGNPARGPVGIHRLTDGEKSWETCYVFPAGKVRHIHGIVPSPNNGCVYILTGDEDGESGIWVARQNFKVIEPWLVGTQQYRSCQLFMSAQGGYYFTDAPSEQNWLYRLGESGAHRMERLPGTCIYGAWQSNRGVFSTTCEPDAKAKNRLEYWLTNRPGKGIQDRKTHIFALEESGKLTELTAFPHDGLPLRLFQYATATFTGFWDNRCFFTAMNVKKKDMRVFSIQIHE